LASLFQYLNGGWDRPTSKLEQLFVEKFFGKDDWALFLYESTDEGRPSYFSKCVRVKSELSTVRHFLAFEVSERFSKLANAKIPPKENNKKLKQDLQTAVEDSYEDGEFCKIEGWLNISEVLQKHKLLKL